MKKSEGIYSPDFITTGYYTVGDIVDYFEGIREKWRESRIEEIKSQVSRSISQTRKVYEAMLSNFDAQVPKRIQQSIEHAIEKLKDMEKEIIKNRP